MQRVSSRQLGHTAGTYVVEVPLVSEFVQVGLNAQRAFSVWVRHKADAQRVQRWRITVAPVSMDVGEDEQLLGMCEVYGVWHDFWGVPLPD